MTPSGTPAWAGAGQLRSRSRHDADRAGAGDQDVFPEHGKRQRGMHRIAKRIKDGCNLKRNRLRVLPHVHHGHDDEFSEGARAVYAYSLRVCTKMPPACQAVATASANDVALTADNVSGIVISDIRAHFDDLAHKFVPNNHRYAVRRER